MGEARCRVGMVAVIGRPNVGKSTLINALVGERVSITSRKPQTTRERVLGVRTTADAQFIFVDTPGFQRRHRSALNRRMNDAVTGALAGVDAVILVIDAAGWTPADEQVLQLLPKDSGNVLLALNKTDLLAQRERLLPLMAASMQRFPFHAIVPVSAEKGRQLDELLAEVRSLLPEGVPLFDAEQYTDRSARFLAAETVREKAYRLLGDELPYGIAVVIDRWEEEEGAARVAATLVVEREAHKGIVIGKDGAKLREISRLARVDIEQMLGKPVYLEVWVRVKKGWSDDPAALRRLGYG
ncbi:MAG TPA: GTPase Era [Burkholderiaceae bacterium]|nr:GTPase Era [Burkholderiaceae bacterium]HQR72478.1 GTPase Era [Burkholderiaceae bacterium]